MDSYQLLIYSPIESPQSPSLSKVLSYCSWGTVASSFVITTSTQQLNVSKMSRTRCKSKKQNLLAIYKFSYNLLIISLYPIKTLFEILVFHNQVQCRQHLVMNYRPPLFYTALKCFPDWGWTPETFRIKRFLREKKKKKLDPRGCRAYRALTICLLYLFLIKILLTKPSKLSTLTILG